MAGLELDRRPDVDERHLAGADPADQLQAAPILCDYLRQSRDLSNYVLVAGDVGESKEVEDYATRRSEVRKSPDREIEARLKWLDQQPPDIMERRTP